MIEAYGNIWDHIEDYDAIVITTNGYVKKNGELVMGRGIALDAKNRYPGLAKWAGTLVQHWGAEGIFVFEDPNWEYKGYIINFPVKPAYGPNGEPGWRVKADIDMIERSAKELTDTINKSWKNTITKIIMPRPGCGNGGLRWEQVKPVIEPYLDDRFTVMEKL